MRAVNDRHLAALGADPGALDLHYEIEPRPGRPQVFGAFTLSRNIGRSVDGRWRSAEPWMIASYAEGSLGNLGELLHESGHGLHYASIRTRPGLFEPLRDDGGFVEGMADVLGWDVSEPAFQDHYFGRSVPMRQALVDRYGEVMLDICWALFEWEVHRDPTRRPNDVWSELTSRYLGIVPHPEWSWWAVRSQLVESPGYMANCALAAIVSADVRARLREVRGDWSTGDPSWYNAVAEGLLRFGASRPVAEVLADFLGRPLSVDALLADVARIDSE